MTEKNNVTDYQLYLFGEGTNYHTYRMFGAHPAGDGYRFSVWAPRAASVSVVGEFNAWSAEAAPMKRNDCGVWEVFIPGVSEGMLYKYYITGRDGVGLYKADPYAFASELRPGTASVTASLGGYRWGDGGYCKKQKPLYDRPVLIYEAHPGSWRKNPDGSFYSYGQLGDELIDYVCELGCTHIELMPISEHPYDGSWGYQVTGYYSVTSRYGSARDFKRFVDRCHQKGVGVILDWVPAHFPKDAHGLSLFDGAPLYEYADPRIGEHYEWGTRVFDFGRGEVVQFLISNAMFWFDEFHIDGLRVDAVSSMLYRNYNRSDGSWIANDEGGAENKEAVRFLQTLNQTIFEAHPNALMIAEESTAWPFVTMPVHQGGLGFNYKWNMGWMNDVLRYFALDPFFRKGAHRLLTFSMFYAFSENYILPLSHDEVVHGKGSLIEKMSGTYEEKFANLRCLFAYAIAHPGKKLLFMGGENAQFLEWRFYEGLDWDILRFETHRMFRRFVTELYAFYKGEKALWENDRDWEGFQWINTTDAQKSILSFQRISGGKKERVVVVCNLTSVFREQYAVGVPQKGTYEVIFTTDREELGGSGLSLSPAYETVAMEADGHPCRLTLSLPPLSVVFLKRKPNKRSKKVQKLPEAQKG